MCFVVRSFLMFILAFNIGVFQAFSASNYKPIKGLNPKENRIEDEGTREIVIRKRETISYDSEEGNSSLFGLQEGCSAGECNYISFGFTNQSYTKVSKTTFTNLEKLDFATPVSDKRYSVEMTFGGKFPSPYFGYEVGIIYDLAYFKDIINNDPQNMVYNEFGIHIISPSIRILLDAFPNSAFSIYLGAEVGFAIIDFIKGSEYDVKFAPKFGGIGGFSYKFGSKKSYELFLGYRAIVTPEKEFILKETINNQIEEKKYKTDFMMHGVHLGIKIKI